MTAWRQPRTLADFGGIEALRPAERKLLDERDTGLIVRIGDGMLPPEDALAERRVRASFLRWLILGADGAEGRTHEKGVRVTGALIESDGPEGATTRGLDLEDCVLAHVVELVRCRFEDRPHFHDVRLPGMNLNGSRVPGLSTSRLVAAADILLGDGFESDGEIRLRGARIGGVLDCSGAQLRNAGAVALRVSGARIEGTLFLHDGFESDGEVFLVGARIGGNLSCVGARLRNAGGRALSADGLATTGEVRLSDGFESDGEIRLVGASIDGDLTCVRAKLRNAGGAALSADGLRTTGTVFLSDGFVSDGAIRLLGARIGGTLSCSGAKLRNAGGDALNASGARVTGALFLRGDAAVDGIVDLQAAEIGSLNDDPICWPARIRLDRCTYKAFTGREWTAVERIAWLDRQDPEDGFRPQPWEQCAKVLRESGHAEDARVVLIAKEKRQRWARRGRAAWWMRPGLWVWDGLLGLTVRYGRQPMRAFAWLGGFWLVGAVLFAWVWGQGGMMPSSVFLARGEEWVRCGAAVGETVALSRTGTAGRSHVADGLRAPGATQLDCFLATKEAGSLPPVAPLVYSLDALLPVVVLHQEEHWTPNADTQSGAWGLRYLWAHIIAGWLLSLLAVAGFSGLVKSD